MKEVYTLQDLQDEPALNPPDAPPARLAVIGNPIAHSRSPQLHQPALDALDLDCRYIRLLLEPGELPAALKTLPEKGFLGANVTVPFKLEAMANCTSLDAAAEAIGAVNTLIFSENEIAGYNTDGPGFAQAIREEFSVDLSDLRIMVVGAGGGAGQAIATQCALAGCDTLVLVNRTVEKLAPLQDRLAKLMADARVAGPTDRLRSFALDDRALETAAAECDLIVQTTSLGLKSTDQSPLPASYIEPHHLVYDTIYEPSRTAFLRSAEARGARIANGLSMLKHQGALAFERWFPGTDPLPHMALPDS